MFLVSPIAAMLYNVSCLSTFRFLSRFLSSNDSGVGTGFHVNFG
jgi:hypothetical protein